MKTVRPINKERWICLLAVCFTSKKAFAWDLDYGSGDLETVQGHLLRFFCEHELPLVVWSDNAGAFRNVIEQALLKACGLKARHIPPGRPQSNGLVEVFNRILDQGHMGERQNLLSAVLAHNTRPDPALGASPETLWRTLRPALSRWRNLQLRTLLQTNAEPLSDEAWLEYLEQSDTLGPEDFRKAVEQVHSSLAPVQEAISDRQASTSKREMQKQSLNSTAEGSIFATALPQARNLRRNNGSPKP